jgi:hypothetical protein
MMDTLLIVVQMNMDKDLKSWYLPMVGRMESMDPGSTSHGLITTGITRCNCLPTPFLEQKIG